MRPLATRLIRLLAHLIFDGLLRGIHSILLSPMYPLQTLLNQMQRHPQRVPTLLRRPQQLAQRLPHQRHLIRQTHIAPNQQETSPIRRMRKMLRVLHSLHRLSQRLCSARTLQQRRIEGAQQNFRRRIRHRPQ